MNRYSAFLFASLCLILMVGPFACSTTGITLPPPFGTATPTRTSTVLASTGTPANSTPTGSATPTNTVTATPGCASYFDNFSGNTLANYSFFDAGTQSAGTAAGEGYVISGGYLEDVSGGSNGGLVIVNNSLFNNSLSNYTVEADFEMDSYQGNLGVFGIAFRTGSNGSFYCFQWNGDPLNASGGTHDWEIEKNTGSPSVSFTYPAGGSTTPAYTLGTWVHLKVAAAGNNFKCYVNFNDGVGDRLVFNLTDTSSPYTSGGVGVRTYGINSPNVARIDNFFVNAQSCAGLASPTPSVTPTTTCSGTTYSDNFSSNTLSNYDITDGSWIASTASAQSIQITGGEFQIAPPSVVYPYTILQSAFFSQALGDYRVEGDFKLDTVSQGVFGLVFRSTPASAEGYIFQWNGLNSEWEIEKQYAPATYYYPATNSASPYTLGTWVHLKVVASGSSFTGYETSETGPGVGLGTTVTIFNGVSDPGTTTPYTAGRVGIRAYNVVGGNILHVQNFIASTCP